MPLNKYPLLQRQSIISHQQQHLQSAPTTLSKHHHIHYSNSLLNNQDLHTNKMSSPSSSNTSNSTTPSSSSSIPPTTPFTDHYAILGISPASHSQTIHTAYQNHLSISHPRNFHPNTFTSGFILSRQAQWEKIVRAKDILSNPTSRAIYDAKYEEAKMMEEEEEEEEMIRQQQGERKNSRSVEEWMERINALVAELAMVGEENVRLREEGRVLKKEAKGRDEEVKRLRGEGEEGVWDLDFL